MPLIQPPGIPQLIRTVTGVVPPAPAIDPDGSVGWYVDTQGRDSIMVGATSDTPGSKMVFNLFFTDGLNVVIGTIQRLTLIASQAPEWGKQCSCGLADGQEPAFHCRPADKAFVQVLSILPATATFTLSAAAG